MSIQIFESVPNWQFSQKEEKAVTLLDELRKQAFSQLPPEHKSNRIICLFKQIKTTKLYEALKTMPKGVLHHVHFDCCEDQDFYTQHIVTDPIVYLNKDMNGFQLGTKEQAQSNGWISMAAARQKFDNQKAFIGHISNITMLNKQQISGFLTKSSAQCWDLFQKKICGIFPILGAAHLFKKYTLHTLRKFVKNGYDRIEFRALLTNLNQYNELGEVVKVHDKKKFMQIVDEAYEIVRKQHPILSIGFIFFALKFLKPEQNQQILTEVLQQKWDKTIGIDFVQQEDPNGSQAPYDEVANKVLSKFPDQKISKVYHSGETKDHLNRNVQISIQAGSVRIGHGINVTQHPTLLHLCKQKGICFEKCPVSNMVLSYVHDPRAASCQLLLGLGVPVTLSPDDPARFGLEDTTMDFFISYISSNWSLKHLKLLAIHSINHAICSQEHKKGLIESFRKRWDLWIDNIKA